MRFSTLLLSSHRKPQRGRTVTRQILQTIERLEERVVLTEINFPGQTLPVAGVNTSSVISVDVDGDNLLDLVATSYSAGTTSWVTVLRNRGADGFEREQYQIGTNLRPRAITAVDVDGDSKVDLITANENTGSYSVLLNQGDGTFLPQASQLTGAAAGVTSRPFFVTALDVNDDLHQDLVVANEGSGTLSVLLNQGNGVFANPVEYIVGRSPRTVVAADVDGDDRLDLVVACHADDQLTILRNLGNGTFGDLFTQSTGLDPRGVTAADLNGDGASDLISANEGNHTVTVLLNLGNGDFATGDTYAVGLRPQSVTAIDVDDDGVLDIVTANYGDDSLSVLKNDGTGSLTRLPDLFVANGGPVAAVTGDFNGDGQVDLATANWDASTVAVLDNVGDGHFQSEVRYSVNGVPVDIISGDFNVDGSLDVATVNSSSGTVSVFLNQQDGALSAVTTYTIGASVRALTTADLNGDGQLDLVVASGTTAGKISILLNAGDGTFALQAATYAVGSDPRSVITAKIDDNDSVDIVVVNRDSGTVSVLINTGGGSFAPQTSWAVGVRPESVLAADVNEDGDIDLVAANQNSGSISVLMNDGHGSFLPQQVYLAGNSPVAVVAGDVNGDGHLDVVTANQGAANVSVLLNQGDGTFVRDANYSVGSGPRSLTAVDLDRNGHIDLAVGYSGGVSLLMNQGGGVFSAAVRLSISSNGEALLSVDIDADRRVDLVTIDGIGGSTGSVVVLRNFPASIAGGADADLVVASLSSSDTTVDLGQSVSIQYQVANSSDFAAAGPWVDHIYLSSNARWDSTDVLLASVVRTDGLAPNASYLQSVEVLISAAAARFTPGEWHLLVRTDALASVLEASETNNLSSVAMTVSAPIETMNLNSSVNGSLNTSGSASYYRLDFSGNRPLLFSLDYASDSDHTEIYVRKGSIPTRATYDYRYSAVQAADHSILIPNATAGPWYILVYGRHVATPAGFTLHASSPDVVVAEVSPTIVSNGQVTSLTLKGTGFLPGTQVSLIAEDGTEVVAAKVVVNSFEQLTATLPLEGVATGYYDVRVQVPQTVPVTVSDQIELRDAGSARLETRLILPGALGRHAVATLYVEYTNSGLVPMDAPILFLQSSDPDGSDRPLLTLDQSRLTAGFWTSSVPDGFSHIAQIYATGATPGLLLPGETVRVPVYYAGLLQPWDMGDTSVELEVRVHQAGSAQEIDWESLKQLLKPSWIEPDAWEVAVANLSRKLVTWGDYVNALAENAAYLREMGHSITDISQLYAFELQQAIGLNPTGTLASDSDAAIIATGLTLDLIRTYDNSLQGRHVLGPFGYGWSADWLDITLSQLADGTVTLRMSSDAQRRFQPDSRSTGVYFSQPGDAGVLRRRIDGVFELTETSGRIFRFMASGKLTAVEDHNGNAINLIYTADRLAMLSHTSGKSLTFSYTAAGRVSRLTDDAGRTTTYTYNSVGTLLLEVNGPNGTTTYDYYGDQTAAHKRALRSIASSSGVTRFYEYDDQGRLSSTYLTGDSERIRFTYDGMGRVVVSNSTGQSITIFFDHRGLIVRREDGQGIYTLFDYNTLGQLIRRTDSLGQSRVYSWCSCGGLLSMTDELGHTTEFALEGPRKRPSALVDALGNSTVFGYDVAGNPTGTRYPDNSEERVLYNSNGIPTHIVNRRGQSVSVEFSAAGRLTRETFPDGVTNHYTYDERGRLTEVDSSVQGVTQFTYDSADRLLRVVYPNERWLSYEYDSAGRRTRMSDHTGLVVQYTYGKAGRVNELRDGDNERIVAYEYDDSGRLRREDKGNGTFTVYEYDSIGQLTFIGHHAPDGTLNSKFVYEYDLLGRRTRVTTFDGEWTYGYDVTGQLTHATYVSSNAATSVENATYVYDALGNRVKTIQNGAQSHYTVNSMNQYVSVGDTTYQYDLDGNLIRESSANGIREYSYNALNQLVRLVSPEGLWEYEYDAFGNRVSVTINGERTELLVDPFGLGQVVGEFDESGNRKASYVYGLGLEAIDRGGIKGYYESDALGSTVNITVAGGAAANSYTYDVHGGVISATEAIANPFQYVGALGVSDDGSGLHFMRARYYSAESGRFVSQDPIRLIGGSVNLYAYVGNAPTSNVDPTGLISWESVAPEDWGLFTGGVVAVATGTAAVLILATSSPVWAPVSALYGLIAMGSGAVSIAASFQEEKIPLMPGGPLGVAALAFDDPDISATAAYLDAVVSLRVDGLSLYGSYSLGTSLIGLNPPLSGASPGSGGSNGSSGTVQSLDPNEKLAGSGIGPQAFVSANSVIPYVVHFENLGPGSQPVPANPATAPAQRVEVSDQLSGDLDWSTFSFTGAGYGDTEIDVPEGLHYHLTNVPMSWNGQSFNVQIEFDFNVTTGHVRVVFQSLEEGSFLPPDVQTGFLPPEDGTGIGQGFISFAVRPKANLPSGTEVRNVAEIRFDNQVVIATNQIDPQDPEQGTSPEREALQTIDSAPPVSTVHSLPALSSVTFPVTWSGNDDEGGSGIAGYSIFVSTNGGPFSSWIEFTSDLSAEFQGIAGNSYAFMSLAYDRVGHREVSPSSPATTVVTGPETLGNVVVTASRNGSVTIQGDSQSNGLKIEAGEVAGSITITAIGATTVNSQPSVTLLGVTGNLTIDLGSGDDILHLGGDLPLALRKHLSVNAGAGDDRVSVRRLQLPGKSTFVGESGADIFDLVESSFGKSLGLDLGPGENVLNIQQTQVQGKTVVVANDGQHEIDVRDTVLQSHFSLSSTSGGAEVRIATLTVAGKAALVTGSASDDFELLNSVFAGNFRLASGGGDDTASIHVSTFEGKVLIDGAAGTNTLDAGDPNGSSNGNAFRSGKVLIRNWIKALSRIRKKL